MTLFFTRGLFPSPGPPRTPPPPISGGLSTIVGLFYILQAFGDDPKLDVLSVYAAGGGVWFVLQAAVPAWRSHRLAAQTA